MKKITGFTINTTDMAAAATSRQFIINGEKDAEFILQVFDNSSPVKFYDFNAKSFSTIDNSSEDKLLVKMDSNVFTGNINFPANGSGATYTILLLATPDKDTEIKIGASKNLHNITITQLADFALTLSPSTGTSANYETLPTSSSTLSSTSTDIVKKEISWSILNKLHDSYGYGLRLTRQPIDTDWYFQKQEDNVGGTSASSNQVVVADLTDLTTGMELTYITGTTAPGAATIIKAIDIKTKTLTLSRNQEITDTHTMTFRAKGSKVIKRAIGLDLDFSNWKPNYDTITFEKNFTKRVRATGTNTVIALNNTYGLTGGGHVRVNGLNVVNTSVNKIQSVNADADGTGGDGTITVQVNQTAALSVGTILRFFGDDFGDGSRDKLELNNYVIIRSHPNKAITIYLNLDNFITLGAAS